MSNSSDSGTRQDPYELTFNLNEQDFRVALQRFAPNKPRATTCGFVKTILFIFGGYSAVMYALKRIDLPLALQIESATGTVVVLGVFLSIVILGLLDKSRVLVLTHSLEGD